MNDDDYMGPDPSDELFDNLDKLVEFAKESVSKSKDSNKKFDASLDLINLMMEEVPAEEVKISQQIGGAWIAEVRYHGINFICIVGRHKPQFWDEIFEA